MGLSTDYPDVVLVPPSPLPSSQQSSSSTANVSPSLSRSTSESTSTQDSSLDLYSSRPSDSSDRTTLCSIYTMYTDEVPKRSLYPSELPTVTRATALAVQEGQRPRSFNLPQQQPSNSLARASTGQKYANFAVNIPPVNVTVSPPPRQASLHRTLPSPRSPEAIPLPPSLAPSRSPSPLPVPQRSVSSLSSNLPQQAPNEESDAHHVRSTYALLDQVGVPHDGFSEGIERTRARVGAARASQLLASGTLGTSHEKSRDLEPAELSLLNTVDRYGFFNNENQSGNERMVLLPRESLGRKGLMIMKNTGKNSQPNPSPLSRLPPPQPTKNELSRTEKWGRMLVPNRRDSGTWSIKRGKEKKLRRRVYKGIPDRWRGAAWGLLIDHVAALGKGKAKAADLTVDHVDVDLTDSGLLEKTYEEAVTLPSTYDVQIDLDVPRTISGHLLFKTRYGAGQRSLFFVLHAFSLRCEPCGYVQGMGPITSTLLLYLPPPKVYASLCILHSSPRYTLHTLFSPGFPGLLENIYVQERLIETYLPSAYQAFKTIGVSTTSYATKWYITMFANSVPFQTQLRLWDVWFLEGQDTWVALAVCIVFAFRDHIQSDAANFETVLSLLSGFFVMEDEDALLNWMEQTLSNHKLRIQMRQWRIDWKGMVERGEDMNALL